MLTEENRGRLKVLWDMHFDEMLYLCLSITSSESVSEDIVADAFYALYKKLGTDVEGAENIRSFLYTTCRDAALRYGKHPSYEYER